MLVLCLSYATIQEGTPPPHFTLSSLGQQGHCKKAKYSKFLIASNLTACVPFCFISIYKPLRLVGTYYPIIYYPYHLLLTTAYSHAGELLNPPVIPYA